MKIHVLQLALKFCENVYLWHTKSTNYQFVQTFFQEFVGKYLICLTSGPPPVIQFLVTIFCNNPGLKSKLIWLLFFVTNGKSHSLISLNFANGRGGHFIFNEQQVSQQSWKCQVWFFNFLIWLKKNNLDIHT